MHTLTADQLAALGQYLDGRVPGFAGEPLSARRFSGGQSNPTYQLATAHGTWVMRTKPAPVARLLPSAHAIEREYRVMAALHGTGVPVPGMHVLCEDESVIGRAFYVMQYLEGRVLWDPALPGLEQATRTALYGEMNRVLATLHRVDFAAVGLSDHGRPGDYVARQIARWRKQYEASVTEPISAMDRLMDWLPAHLPASASDPSEVALVHGDYRLDNLMFHPTEPRAIALLDWELSTLGHPLADFSYHCMAWHIAPDVFRGMAGADLASLGIPDEAAYVRAYCERTGRSDAEAVLADWPFYLAFNLFRMAAILQGIAKRVEDGIATDAQARQSAAAARPLAEMGWRIAQAA